MRVVKNIKQCIYRTVYTDQMGKTINRLDENFRLNDVSHEDKRKSE